MRLVTEAGKHLLGLAGKMKSNMGSTLKAMSPGEIAMTTMPDLAFGGMAAAFTPGDATDKALAGIGSAAGGVLGGFGIRGAFGVTHPLKGMAIDLGGSVVGDMAGMKAADEITRIRHGGVTPMEQEQLKYQKQLEDQIRMEVMQQYGIRPQGQMQQGYY